MRMRTNLPYCRYIGFLTFERAFIYIFDNGDTTGTLTYEQLVFSKKFAQIYENNSLFNVRH
jgi:hypothetical protein